MSTNMLVLASGSDREPPQRVDEMVKAGEFRGRRSEPDAPPREDSNLSRDHSRGLFASIDREAGKPSADYLRCCFHLVNSSPDCGDESWRYSRCSGSLLDLCA
jgi:hypothetical protein